MIYQHNQEQANFIMGKSLAFLEQHALSSTPVNYAVAYELQVGKNIGLRSDYEETLKNKTKIDNYVMQHLYFSHIHKANEADQEFAKPFTEILRHTLTEIEESRKVVTYYQKELDDSEKKLNDFKPETTKQLITKLKKSTKMLKLEQQKLANRLQEAETETHSLRVNLAKIEKEATIDSLSQLLNRQGLHKAITHTKFDYPNNSIIIFDIDDFKNINDQYGHIFGDHVIKHVAKEIKSRVRGRDLAIRYGGEEFLVILTDTEIKGAQIVGEKIRNGVERLRWRNVKTGQQLPSITLSGGVTQLKRTESLHDDINIIISRADEALYRAKSTGKNNVKFK